MTSVQQQNSQIQSETLANQEEESLFDFSYDQPGTSPGTIRINPDAPQPKIVLIDYNEQNRSYLVLPSPKACEPHLDTESVSWVDIAGLGNEAVLREMGEVFKLHPLVLEDIVNVPQRPKVEDYDDHLVLIARMVVSKGNNRGFWSEQVSFILGKHYLLTVQEEPERDSFNPVRDRIRYNKGTIRKRGADYLAYALLDAVIDGYFPVLEEYGERIEELEDEVVSNPTRSTLEKIYQMKRELLALRRAIWPQRDAINSLIRDGSDLISEDVRVYLRDCYDHSVQVLDIVETYRELTSGLMDVYLSAVGNRMNEIMKLLTVVSAIFIPLTFIAGVYGMNFNTEESPLNMPELNWYFGYPLCIAAMLLTAGGLIYFFWKRGWFENFSTIQKPKN